MVAPWGLGVTYSAYGLLLLSLIGFFFQKDTVFRKTLSRVLQSSAFLLLFLLVPMRAEAAAQDAPNVLPKEVSDCFGELFVYYNGRVCPFETLAREYTLKAYGKSHWGDYDACQVVTGWLFYYDWWRDIPFKLKAKDRGTEKEEEKVFLLRSVGKIRAYQEKEAAAVLPSAGKVRAEKCYNRIPRPMVLFMAAITWGMVLFLLLGLSLSRGKRFPRGVALVSAGMAWVLLLYLSLTLGLRWYVSGHAPFAGSYCVMMLMAWLSTLGICLLWKKFPPVLPSARFWGW